MGATNDDSLANCSDEQLISELNNLNQEESKLNDDSLFSMSNDIKPDISASPTGRASIEENKQYEESPMQKLAKRKGNIQDKTIPHLTNLHEDQQLSGINYYSLGKGEIKFGRRNGKPVPEVILGAIGIKQNHAKIVLNDKGLFKLVVVDGEAAANTLVNGE